MITNKMEVMFGEFYRHKGKICKVCGKAYNKNDLTEEVIIYCYVEHGTASDAYYCSKNEFENSGEFTLIADYKSV